MGIVKRILFPLICLLGMPAQAQVVIANPEVHLSELSRDDLRAIYSMQQRSWPDGGSVTVFVLPDRAPLHKAFSKILLGVFPYQLRRRWDRLIFSGTGQAPIRVANEQEMRRRVAATPGAIGYLEAAQPGPEVKVIHVN